MGPLSHDEILNVHAAIVSAHLVESRSALLVGIEPSVVAGLPSAANLGDQILRDIDALNAAGALADGAVPIATWLANAEHQAGVRKEAAVFKALLKQVEGAAVVAAPNARVDQLHVR